MTTRADLPAGLIESIRQHGVGIWPGFLEDAALSALRDATHDLIDSQHALRFPKSTRVWDLYRHGSTFLDLLADERLDAMLAEVLDSHYLLSDYSLNVVNPDQPIDDWHIDYPYNEMPHLVTGAILGVQCVLAIDEFTHRNGATHYIPGTHQPPRSPDPAAVTAYQTLQAPPGTLMVMTASTWHRSGRNTSDLSRTGILLSFVERWIRPMVAPPAPGPWSHTAHLRRMLGQERPPETINGMSVTGPAQ